MNPRNIEHQSAHRKNPPSLSRLFTEWIALLFNASAIERHGPMSSRKDLRSPWHHEPRARLSEQNVAKLFLERGGRCGQCNRRLGPADDYIIEHALALENGGTNDWSNLTLTCAWCKPKKDAHDHATAGHGRRMAAKHIISKSMRKKSALSKKPGTKFNWAAGRYERQEDES